ncbi:MAG: threonylcarbamoyl-AMP synthase [Pyrinomonas methylaliphatogenes]|jgi:L-threonylcarbamoyladenylate synthase|nr:threonylcarbamoyl-AMP synthase [Pyrinomonas methylaliphatogenes]
MGERDKRTRIIADGEEARREAKRIIEGGGLIAFLTDTFYGLGADPFNRAAIQSIFRLKGRDEGKPILVIASDMEAASRLIAERTPLFDLFSRKFWPGPLTLVVRAAKDVPEELTAGTGTVGVRIPAVEAVRELVHICGGALTATSANPSGAEPALTAEMVFDYFPTGLDLIVDGGPARLDRPSTVLDVSSGEARIIREGAISRRELESLVAGS